MTKPLPGLNRLAFSGCRLARCWSVLSTMSAIFQGRPLHLCRVLATCLACFLERLSSVKTATLLWAFNSFANWDLCSPEGSVAKLGFGGKIRKSDLGKSMACEFQLSCFR